MYKAKLTGTGAYLPHRILTNKELESVMDTTDEWIVSRSGIRERRIAAPEEATSDLAYEASLRALGDAGVTASQLDAIVVCTITGDMIFPATACLVQGMLQAKKAAAFDLSAACTGFVYGLQLARQGIVAGDWEHVLVIGAETMSRIVDWTDRDTCVIFGDGAGAAVVSRSTSKERNIVGTHLGSDGSSWDVLALRAGGTRMPTSVETVAERKHFLYMNGSEVYKFAVRVVEEAATPLLERFNLTFEDIDFIIPHQANMRIIEGFAKRLKIPMDKVVTNLYRLGNMSSASVPVALHENKHRFKPGDKILLVGFGGGLTWGSALIEW
ncbi:MAG: 3-oxoacyl-(acyl-carrier-protein) synthase 3 [Firmicutes bacterium]|nr:3-oxoacyl-(acyl-carrier-protein) synthase 3 [Bacillota bacterium]